MRKMKCPQERRREIDDRRIGAAGYIAAEINHTARMTPVRNTTAVTSLLPESTPQDRGHSVKRQCI